MSIQRIIEIPLDEVRSPNYDANIKRFGEGVNSCFICGRRIKNLQTAKNVHYLTNGNLISTAAEDIDNSQGLFTIGNDCAKKLVINFAL